MDVELDMFCDVKEKGLSLMGNVVARVSVQALNSQPVDHEDAAKHMAMSETSGNTSNRNLKTTAPPPPCLSPSVQEVGLWRRRSAITKFVNELVLDVLGCAVSTAHRCA
jgi:hypothetical protein